MIKTLTNLFKQDKEKFVVPKGVQDVIPVAAIFDDGIFKVGKDKYSKTYRFTDINYAVASREDKEAMFLEYSELLNSLDSGATTKITINNRRLNRLDFEQTILIPTTGDNLDEYREEYNKMLLDKATGANSIVQDKYITISINKKSVEDARTYFARVGADLIAHFGRLGSKCVELETDERLRIFHDFYRVGEESSFHFDIKETRKKGHDFKDYICPDTMEFEKDYFKMGNRYGRVLFLREYASYSGVRNTGRLTAQGLYNICTPVSQSEAQPGDLIFFTGTYDAGEPVTHIGIYVGNGQMIHCGHPVQYTSINSPYWQSHFYGFGRW